MKDLYDDSTLDMFESPAERPKKVARPSLAESRQKDVDYLQKKVDKGTPITKDQTKFLETYGEKAAQNKPEKAPARPRPMGGGAGTGGGSGGADLKSITNPKSMKKGGKVSSASSRADGIAQRGKTRGRMV